MPSSNKQNPKNNICCNMLLDIPFVPEVFIENVLAHLQLTGSELEFTFFDNASIHEMNREHLDHDWPTDIITFDLSEGDDDAFSGTSAPEAPADFAERADALERDQKGGALLGDLYISVEQAQIQADTLGHSLEKELKILIIHGILHLLGYDDQTPEDQTVMDEMQHQIYDLLHTPV
jgi:probable rRNA maturation factor